jgi:hypothetical protein
MDPPPITNPARCARKRSAEMVPFGPLMDLPKHVDVALTYKEYVVRLGPASCPLMDMAQASDPALAFTEQAIARVLVRGL